MDFNEFQARVKALGDHAQKKYSDYLIADREIAFGAKNSLSGFVDKRILDKLAIRKREWQMAASNYAEFLKYGYSIVKINMTYREFQDLAAHPLLPAYPDTISNIKRGVSYIVSQGEKQYIVTLDEEENLMLEHADI